jgi:peptidoglycan/xylan/chitin deacetylase (PgdA/CDA1 family)
MKICFVSIDIESDFAKGRDFKGAENIEKVLKIFKSHNIKATLFVTGKILEKYQDKFKNLSQEHEIACHSFSHSFWNELKDQEREKELIDFISLYKSIFNKAPAGFRAPSHVIDQKGLEIVQEKGFLYDSSVVPSYPVFKKYRGYKGKALNRPYFPDIKDYKKAGAMNVLEIPVAGLFLGVPLAGTWIRKLPLFVYNLLFFIKKPNFLTFSLHSWDSLNSETLTKIDKLLNLLKENNYQFLKGIDVYAKFSENRR